LVALERLVRFEDRVSVIVDVDPPSIDRVGDGSGQQPEASWILQVPLSKVIVLIPSKK
jgi:hypothetical protein